MKRWKPKRTHSLVKTMENQHTQKKTTTKAKKKIEISIIIVNGSML